MDKSKINLAVFASTKGTDLQVILDGIRDGSLDFIDLKFVLSNRQDCYALERARQAGFKTIFIDPKGKTREEFDEECLRICQEQDVDLILLIGYMRIITPVLVKAYTGKIWNIHPSLLPKYPGMDTDVHQAVLDNHEAETGCTLHIVDEGVDTGPIILQEKITVARDDTVDTLKTKVQELEQGVILRGLRMFFDGKLK